MITIELTEAEVEVVRLYRNRPPGHRLAVISKREVNLLDTVKRVGFGDVRVSVKDNQPMHVRVEGLVDLSEEKYVDRDQLFDMLSQARRTSCAEEG